ncbi:hypothetical protein AAGF08_04865 [Algoriphagus sp. SE2]|uniref:hypothetical protein n=1 Tax=Algoriphagus sp. SE2 TaxID=3141536 RepID=UPI0031CD6B6F
MAFSNSESNAQGGSMGLMQSKIYLFRMLRQERGSKSNFKVVVQEGVLLPAILMDYNLNMFSNLQLAGALVF